MNKLILAVVTSVTLFSGEILLTEFKSGGVIKASEMNGNFEALKIGIKVVEKNITTNISNLKIRVFNVENQEVVDFSDDISNLEIKISELETAVTSLEAKNQELQLIINSVDMEVIKNLTTKVQLLETILYPHKEEGNETVVTGDVITVDGVFERNNLLQVVTDNSTGFMFSDEVRTIQKMSWSNGNSFCTNLELGGYSDWRIPTKEELGIVAGESIFVNKEDGQYWDTDINEHTRNGYDFYDDYGYKNYVNWSSGSGGFTDPNNLYYIVCIRSIL